MKLDMDALKQYNRFIYPYPSFWTGHYSRTAVNMTSSRLFFSLWYKE